MARAMKDSGIEWIGKIPEEWDTVRFKFLHCGMNTGEAIDKEFWSENVEDSVFYTAGLKPIRTNYGEFPDWKYTGENDILLARNGTPYVYNPPVNAVYTDHIIRASLRKGVNKPFILFGLQQSISNIVVETVSIPTWSASLWDKQEIPYPSTTEQQKIANFLDSKCASIDAVIEKTKASIEEYKKLKQAIITQAVTKGIRPNRKMKDSGIDYLGEMPCDWSVTSISKLFSFLGGYAFQSERFCEKTDFQVIRIGNVKNDKLLLDEKGAYIDEDYSEEAIKSLIKVDDILFTMTGTKGKQDYFFTLVVNEEDVKGRRLYLNQRVGSFRQKKNGILMHYYNYVLKLQKIKDYIFLFETGTANQGNLGIETIKRTKLYVPPFDEQWEIVEYVKNKCEMIDSIIDFKEKTVSEQNELKKSLIYEYVTGKKEVPDCY